jgi:hypothetical protein
LCQFDIAGRVGNHHARHAERLGHHHQVEEVRREIADDLLQRTPVLFHLVGVEEALAVGDQHRVEQAGLAAELDVDGAHRHVRFARQHLQADLAVAVLEEQASRSMDEIVQARLAIAAARAAGTLLARRC